MAVLKLLVTGTTNLALKSRETGPMLVASRREVEAGRRLTDSPEETPSSRMRFFHLTRREYDIEEGSQADNISSHVPICGHVMRMWYWRFKVE
jgi:hypothetical protein